MLIRIFSTGHIFLVCAVVFLLFGRNLFSNTMKDLGEGLRQLRHLRDDEEDSPK